MFERFNTPVFEADFNLDSMTFFPLFDAESDDELEPMTKPLLGKEINK